MFFFPRPHTHIHTHTPTHKRGVCTGNPNFPYARGVKELSEQRTLGSTQSERAKQTSREVTRQPAKSLGYSTYLPSALVQDGPWTLSQNTLSSEMERTDDTAEKPVEEGVLRDAEEGKFESRVSKRERGQRIKADDEIEGSADKHIEERLRRGWTREQGMEMRLQGAGTRGTARV